MITFSGFAYMFSTFVCWFYAYKFRRSYLQRGRVELKSSSIGSFLLGLSLFLYGIPCFITPDNQFLFKLSYIVGHAILFIGFSLIIKTAAHFFIDSGFLKNLPLIVLFIGFVLTCINIFYSNQANPWMDEYGLAHWGQYIVPRLAFLISTLGISAAIGITFLIKKLPEEINLKLKSIFLTIAFLVAGCGGAMICFFNDSIMLLVSYLFLFVGFLFAFLTSLIRKTA